MTRLMGISRNCARSNTRVRSGRDASPNSISTVSAGTSSVYALKRRPSGSAGEAVK